MAFVSASSPAAHTGSPGSETAPSLGGPPAAKPAPAPAPAAPPAASEEGVGARADRGVQELPSPAPAAPATAGTVRVTLNFDHGFAFRVNPQLPGAPGFTIDEPPPLGEGRGPNPSRVLASAVASCLASSLLFCLRKARIEVRDLKVSAEGTLIRNPRGRLRIGAIRVELRPRIPRADEPRLGRCVELFEDFCVVTGSVRPAIEVAVNVVPEIED